MEKKFYKITYRYDTIRSCIVEAKDEDEARDLFFEGEFTDDQEKEYLGSDIEAIDEE